MTDAINVTIAENPINVVINDDPINVTIDTVSTGSGGSGITSVVQDTSPQLGGNLDCNGRNIQLDSDNKISLSDDGNTYIIYNSTTGKMEFYVGSVKKFALG